MLFVPSTHLGHLNLYVVAIPFLPYLSGSPGCNVNVASEKIVLNCIILPHKELARSYKNEILL